MPNASPMEGNLSPKMAHLDLNEVKNAPKHPEAKFWFIEVMLIIIYCVLKPPEWGLEAAK
jgi:hypothetical protein